MATTEYDGGIGNPFDGGDMRFDTLHDFDFDDFFPYPDFDVASNAGFRPSRTVTDFSLNAVGQDSDGLSDMQTLGQLTATPALGTLRTTNLRTSQRLSILSHRPLFHRHQRLGVSTVLELNFKVGLIQLRRMSFKGDMMRQ
jgi:hypothetical protein